MSKPAKIAKTDFADAPDSCVEALEKLDQIQEELGQLEEKATEEAVAIEQRYIKLRHPLHIKRQENISKVPRFWRAALTGHPALRACFSEEDGQILDSLTEITVKDNDDLTSGYSVSFHFEPNTYFEETVLTKEIYLLEEKLKATTITWKAEKNPFAKSKRPSITDSFFYWFICDKEKDIVDEIGEAIKNDIWGNPLNFVGSDGSEIESGDDESEGDSDNSEGEGNDSDVVCLDDEESDDGIE